ncbi:metallopeptidase family protein [Actinomadura soli]|uniref:metallopeptidase family protein n=1 Tax=Actinomadura soli TaxID=2508997 RepID=UPI001E457672|nr:metallopeptidase family protein [Actinomadura soli]
MRSRVAGVRRRDRHGRGVRGPLTPPQAPVSRTRAERFDDLVEDEVRRLGGRWGRELARVRFTVEEVPSVEPWFDGPVPLGQTVLQPPPATDQPAGSARLITPGEGKRPVRITVYRRPVEARAKGEAEMARLIRDLLVEEVADLLGLSPESVDPSYDSPDD